MENKTTTRLSDEQIEIIAEISLKAQPTSIEDMSYEWIYTHAFQLGAKFYREFTTTEKQ